MNHATTLIQVPGANIITDPIFSERAGPLTWAGPKRHRAPGVCFEDLPSIDIVLLSHNHYDHCDSQSLARLAKRDDPIFLAGLGTRRLLKRFDVERVRELDWWQTTSHSGVELTFAPAQHWSTRGLGDANVNLWGSFFIDAKDATFYFAGDTGWGSHFHTIAERLGRPDVALLPIGAYEPRWFMRPQHINPAEAVDAHLALGATRSVGIHWGTFDLTDEPHDEPPKALARALQAKNIPADAFLALPNGGHITHLTTP
ncbi:MAG: MBL fold metallo-hydrolase [Myxococcota bacterium]